MLSKQTYIPKASEQERAWVLVDLDGAVLGRAATRIANILRGKHKPVFTPHFDMGDFVVAVNANKIRLTGAKLDKKLYRRHSRYRGGLKEHTAGEMLEKKPEDLVRLAVSGMLPKNKMRQHLLKKLKVYGGAEHPHQAQLPQAISLNDKEAAQKLAPKQAAPKPVKAAEPKAEKATAATKQADTKAEKPAAKKPAVKAKATGEKKAPPKKPAAKKPVTKKKASET